MTCRTWCISRQAGLKIIQSRATLTIAPARHEEKTIADCPMGVVGDLSWVPGQYLSRPRGVLKLMEVRLLRLSQLTEQDASEAGWDNLRGLYEDWTQYRGATHPISGDPRVWVLRWVVMSRAKGEEPKSTQGVNA